MKPKKSLGQHFLKSQKVVQKIIETAGVSQEDTVLEVGPGRGALTKALLERAGKVIAVEKDRELKPFLEKLFQKELKNGTLELVFGDILDNTKTLPSCEGKAFAEYKIVANIPYYITGQFLRKFLSIENQPKSITILIQKEVALRIARDKKESILSISVKAYGTPKYIQTVKAREFSPAPNVDSAILHISRISKDFFHLLDIGCPTSEKEEGFFRLIRTGFLHKRKFLARNLEEIAKKDAIASAFLVCNIPKNTRAEDVLLEKWMCLLRNI